jgi:primosomal protein N' (replication factor Y)
MSKTSYVEIDVVAAAQAGQRLFWYIDTTEELQCGELCDVPFGKRHSLGVVIRTSATAPDNIKSIKPVLKKIEHVPALPKYLLQTAVWLKDYYASSSYSVWTTLLPSGLKAKPRVDYAPIAAQKPIALNKLNPKQQIALQTIEQASTRPVLLAGVTGSGKTEVYLHAIAAAIKRRQSTILLVPEIMLTTQLAERLQQHFGQVVIVHSGLKVAERKKIWLNCLIQSAKSEPLVVIGARSALWMPLHNLGLIIIDEEHEPSYKQESFLRYNTVHVAGFIAKNKPLKLVLGSATPAVATTFLAERHKLTTVHLPERHNSNMPEVEIVDKAGFTGSFSQVLETNITKALSKKTQVLLLLNRRGSASSLMCESCGHTSRCPQCDISLSFHGDIARLVCHYCGWQTLPPPACELCGSAMKFIGTGTQKLETELASKWPEARIARLDRDNATWQTMQQLYKDLLSGSVDIVVGTQMISRGLDIENLQLVGIVDADTSLAIPDYTSSERTYQLLAQTAGRAGRRTQMGTVIVQTRNPHHYAIVAAAKHNYDMFYKHELATRKQYAYPPYVYLLKLWYAHANAELATARAAQLASGLAGTANIVILGPTPTMQKRVHGKYVWQIIIKAKQRNLLTGIVSQLPAGWQAEFDPITLI